MTQTQDVPAARSAAGPRFPEGAALPIDERAASRRRWWALATLVFGGTFVFRWLALEFDNDHFRMITQGRQVVAYGELPVRDFVDPGIFLQIFASAGAQLAFGYNLLGEALLTVFFLSLAAALTFLLAARAAGSAPLGLVATLVFIAMWTRLYQYHLAFLPILGLLVGWRYVDRRTVGRLAVVAVVTAIAFLFRHDLGVYLAVATVAMLAVAHGRDGPAFLLRRLALYATLAALPLVPFFAFLAASGGVVEYFGSGLEYTRSEATRQRPTVRPAFAIEPSPPPAPARITVHWVEQVSPEVRAELEQRYRLTAPELQAGRSWRYEVSDSSPANLAALVRDTRVQDTDGVDRARYRLSAPPEPVSVTWQRTWIGWDVFSMQNAVAWLYYLFLGLPIVALAVLVAKRLRPRPAPTRLPGEAPKIAGAAVLGAATAALMLREPFGARLPDVAAPMAVLAAWLLGQWIDPARSSRARRRLRLLLLRPSLKSAVRFGRSSVPLALRAGAALALIAVTWISATVLSQLGEQLDDAKLLAGPRATLRHGREVFTTLQASPPAEAWAPTPRNVPLARYIRACTKPEDRLLVTLFQPDLPFFAGRAFAGDQLFFFPRYRTSPEDQRRTIASLQGQSVPIVLAPAKRYDADFIPEFRLIHEYLVGRYRLAREVSFEEAEPIVYRVLVDRRAVPAGTYEPLSLPCFR